MNLSTVVSCLFGASSFFLVTGEIAENKVEELSPKTIQHPITVHPVSIEAEYHHDSIIVIEKYKEYHQVRVSDSLISLFIKFKDGNVYPKYKIKPMKDSIYSNGYPVYSNDHHFIKIDIKNVNKNIKINDSLCVKLIQVTSGFRPNR